WETYRSVLFKFKAQQPGISSVTEVSIDPAEHEEYSRQQRKQQMKHERRQEYESNTPQNKVYSKTKYTKQEKKAYIGASNKNNTPQLSATAITLDLEEYAKGNANAQENIANVLGALKKDKVAVTSRNETLELANQALNAARKAKLVCIPCGEAYVALDVIARLCHRKYTL
ncbi:hypothetical protein SARC_13619, partial [Sphaeroforma arctica JP610]